MNHFYRSPVTKTLPLFYAAAQAQYALELTGSFTPDTGCSGTGSNDASINANIFFSSIASNSVVNVTIACNGIDVLAYATTGDTGTPVDCADNAGTGGTETLSFNADVSELLGYNLVVHNKDWPTTGSFTVTVETENEVSSFEFEAQACEPAFDDCGFLSS
jgi:hypothetical protein